MIRYGSKLKGMIKDSGYTLKQISEKIDVPASTISSWYKSEFPPLEGIVKMCNFFKIELTDFFKDESKETDESLLSYLSSQDREILNLLNAPNNTETRIAIKELFINSMKIFLLQHEHMLKNNPEYKKIFKNPPRKMDEKELSKLREIDKKQLLESLERKKEKIIYPENEEEEIHGLEKVAEEEENNK